MKRQFQTRLSYPNPFKPVGIEFDLPEKATVTVKIFDETGNELKIVCADEPYIAGEHVLGVDLKNLPENVSYRIIAVGTEETYSETRRLY